MLLLVETVPSCRRGVGRKLKLSYYYHEEVPIWLPARVRARGLLRVPIRRTYSCTEIARVASRFAVLAVVVLAALVLAALIIRPESDPGQMQVR